MDFHFVVNGDQDPRKRRAPRGACDACKRRKKRCIHQSLSPASVDNSSTIEAEKTIAQPIVQVGHGSTTRQPKTIQVGTARRRTSSPIAARFIGDLNPEASLLAAEYSPSRDRSNIGAWADREPLDANEPPVVRQVLAGSGRRPVSPRYGDKSRATASSSPFSYAEQAILADIFFSRIHPLVPILDERIFRRDFAEGLVRPLLVDIICLLALKDNAAKVSRVPGSSLDQQLHIVPSLCHSIREGIAKDNHGRSRIQLIEVLALFSLHNDGGDDSSMYLTKAIHHAQTFGMHLRRPKEPQRSQNIFWSLFCLDKLNAAINGRPQIIDYRDVGQSFDSALLSGSPSFKIMLHLSRLLLEVVELYKPHADPEITGIQEHFADFEAIVEQCSGWDIETSCLASLEIYYHGISILSHRTRSTSRLVSMNPTTASVRQLFSASRISSILRQISPDQLVPHPMVPYAVSLAVASTYRHLRRTKLETNQAALRSQLQCYVEALKLMAVKFRFVGFAITIGQKILDQFQQPLSNSMYPGERALATPASHDRQNRLVEGVTNDRTPQIVPAGGAEHRSPVLTGRNSEPPDLRHTNVTASVPNNMASFADFDTSGDVDALFGDFLDLNLPDFDMIFDNGTT